jgi:adenylate cyclase
LPSTPVAVAKAFSRSAVAASNLEDFDFEKNFPYIQRALELDANNAEAHRIMGNIYMQSGKLDVAEHHLGRAMRLSPSDAYIKAKAASLYTYKGNPERALALIEEAQALDPFLPAWSVAERGVALYALDRFEESHKTFSAIPFSTERTTLYDAASLVASGRIEDARTAARHALTMRPGLTAARFMQQEPFREEVKRSQLRQRVVLAGLPPG